MFQDPFSTLSNDLERLADLLTPSGKAKIEFLEGERREVAILFLDIKGFSTISETIDHEQLHKLMFGVLKTLAGVIEQHGGYVDKYEGDLIMALFGAQRASENDSIRAVQCGLRMFEVLEEINKLLLAKIRVELGARVGINFGWVTVAPDPSGHLTAMGEDVNLASRLESTAQVDTVQVSESVVKECGDYFSWKDLGIISIKGKMEPVHTFRPMGFGKVTLERWKRSAIVQQLPLTGRDEELNDLIELWKNSYATAYDVQTQLFRPSILAIFGDAGIGKSRIMYELEKYIQQHIPEAIILKGYTTYIAQPPFHLWSGIVRNLFVTRTDVHESEQFADTIEELSSLIPAEQREILKKNAPLLQNLIPIPIKNNVVKGLDEKALRMETTLAVRNLFKFLAYQKPLCILLDDLHWIDSGSQEVLEFILKNLVAKHPITFVVCSRTDYDDGRPVQLFQDDVGIVPARLNLKPISDENAAKLFHALLFTYDSSAKEIEEEAIHKLVHYSQGNPFYLEELALDWLESGLLENQNGTFRLTKPVSDSKVPTSIASLLRARMDRLNKDERATLQECAVLGIEFTQTLFKIVREKIAEHDTGDVYLKELELRSFIKSLLSMNDLAYRFRLKTTRNVAYETILHHNRAILHKLTAEALESIVGDRKEQLSGLMSYHFELANNFDKAIEYGLLDLQHHKRTFQNKEGYSVAKHLLLLFHEHQDECSNFQQRYYTTLLLFEAICDTLGKREEQSKCLDTLKGLVALMNDIEKQVEVMLREGNYYFAFGRYGEAKSIYLQTLSLSSQHNLTAWLAASYGNLGILNLLHGEFKDAEQNLLQSIERYQLIGDRRNEAMFLMNLAGYYTQQKRYGIATDKLETALQRFTLMGNTRAIANVTSNFAVLMEQSNQVEEAIVKNESAITTFQEVGDKKGEAIATANLGYCYWKNRDVGLAELTLKKGIVLLNEIGDIPAVSKSYVNLAELYEATNRADELKKLVSMAFPIWVETNKKETLAKFETYIKE